MLYFKLINGKYTYKGKTYLPGDYVESERDLESIHGREMFQKEETKNIALPSEDEQSQEETDYDSMPLEELKEFATELGIKFRSNTPRKTLIAQIQEKAD